jgi:hypothetical protein
VNGWNAGHPSQTSYPQHILRLFGGIPKLQPIFEIVLVRKVTKKQSIKMGGWELTTFCSMPSRL